MESQHNPKTRQTRKNPKNHFPSTEQNPKNPEKPENHFANLGGSGSGFSGYGDLASRSEVVIRVNRVSWKWSIGLWKHNPENPEKYFKVVNWVNRVIGKITRKPKKPE